MSSLIEQYVQRLQDRVRQESEALADGRPVSLEDYRQRVGYTKGLKWALTELEDLWKRVPKEDR